MNKEDYEEDQKREKGIRISNRHCLIFKVKLVFSHDRDFYLYIFINLISILHSLKSVKNHAFSMKGRRGYQNELESIFIENTPLSIL